MQRINGTLAVILVSSGALFSLNAASQEAQKTEQSNTSEPIENRLSIQKTDEQFKQQYIDYSIDQDESKRYLKHIRSNRELLRKIQERELILQYNEQWLKLQKQEKALNQSATPEGANKGQNSKQNLNYTGFSQDQEKKPDLPTLQGIKGGQSATFLYDGQFVDVENGDTLPNGETVEIIDSSTVKLKSKSGTRTLRGMPLGD